MPDFCMMQKKEHNTKEVYIACGKGGQSPYNGVNMSRNSQNSRRIVRRFAVSLINMLYKPFKQIVANMGIPETRFHDLRHSYAVLSLQAGCDIKTLSANLGHSTIALTLDRYGHTSDTMLKQSSDLMQQLIDKL